jgi:hypothetical protein
MKNWTYEELQRAVAEVLRRAAVDPQFRAVALENGAAAIAIVAQKPLPDNLSFNFVDNSGPTKTIPLPDLIPDLEKELDEEALEKVSGGTDSPPPPPVSGGWSKITTGRLR